MVNVALILLYFVLIIWPILDFISTRDMCASERFEHSVIRAAICLPLIWWALGWQFI